MTASCAATRHVSFADPYDVDFESAASRLGNIWIDSGINSLSILQRLMKLTERTSLRSIGELSLSHSVFEAHFTY